MLRNFLPMRCFARRAGMPGINRISKELKDVNDIMKDPEGFGDVESDFMDVHKTHKDYEREQQQRQKQIRHFIVGNKYFKTKQLNFLTYAEKEQIRLLHSRDPDEWNSEKLSESFPATPDTISKILKGKWIANSVARIKRHDLSVVENWKIFNEGKLEQLDPTLTEHLRKFSKRNLEELAISEATVRPKPEIPKPKRTEFSSIISESMKFRKSSEVKDSITSEQHSIPTTDKDTIPPPFKEGNPFKNDQSKNSTEHYTPRINNSAMDQETYLIDKIRNQRPMRFQDLVQKLPETQQDLKSVAMHSMPSPQGTGVLQNHITSEGDIPAIKKMVATEVEISPREMISTQSGIRDRIHIPKHLWKRGCTFKLSDCYYDDDGEFLYRVPGMTGRSAK